MNARHRQRGHTLWLLVALGSLCSACSRGFGDSDLLTVGAFFSLSGADAVLGNESREGVELATDEINAAGGIKGARVRLFMEDDKSNLQETSTRVSQLIERDNVIAVLGEVVTARSKAAGLVANKKHIPMISPSSAGAEVTQGKEYVFRVCSTDDDQGKAGAEFVVNGLGRKRIAVLSAGEDTRSTSLSSSFSASAIELGATIVAGKSYPASETDFTSYLREIKNAGADIVYAPVPVRDMVVIARHAQALGIAGSSFVGADGWDSEDLLKAAGAELEGAHFTSHYAPDVPWPSAQTFVKNYEQRFHRVPTGIAAQGYDAARLLFDAMDRAAGFAPDRIRDAIGATKGFQGATGTISIDPQRNAQKAVVVEQIKNGKFTYSSTVSGS
jgi:branched-chain amino acid transport system substrate-binding protein